MKKIIILLPFIFAIYTVSNTVVDSAFHKSSVKLNLSFLNKIIGLDEVTPTKKPVISQVESEILNTQKESKGKKNKKDKQQININDVKNLSFINNTNDKVKKEKVSNNENKVINKVINKEIDKFSLKNKKILPTNKNKLDKENIEKSEIIELDIKEKVSISSYKNIKKIKKTNWIKFNNFAQEIKLNNQLARKQREKIKNKKFKQKKIISNNIKDKNESDRISTALAATEKSTDKKAPVVQKLKTISTNNRELKGNEHKDDLSKDESLVFFDYAAAKKDLNTQEIVKPQKAKKVPKTLKPTKSSGLVVKSNGKKLVIPMPKLASSSKGKKTKGSAFKTAENSGPIEPESNPNGKGNYKAIDSDIVKSFMSSQKNVKPKKKKVYNKRIYISDYSVQPYSVNKQYNNKEIADFEIRFDDDIDEIKQSYGEASLRIESKLNSSMAIRRGTILTRNHYPTTVDFVLEDNEIIAKIPMLENEYLNQIIRDEKITGLGSQVLVELDRDTEDVDIDKNYERKIFLNRELKIVQRSESDYSFILFLGIEPGNTIINFKNIKMKTLSKIIHLTEDEMYYEPNFYFKQNNDEFELNEEYLLSKDEGPLSLDPKNIKGLTFSNEFKKLTTNRYQVKDVTYPIGMRSYIELKHLKESVYVGRWNNDSITIPSEQYMRFVLDRFDLSSVGSNCLVQLNLPKEAKELYFNGQSKRGAMRMQVNILDKDGIFYKDLSNESEKVFLMGEEQGIINIKVKYVDGSNDYIQSYCSDNTYIVEQL